MACGTCGSDETPEVSGAPVDTGRLRSLLETVSLLAARDFGARIWFAEILGQRWSYIAGQKSETPAPDGTTRIVLAAGLGMVCDHWGVLSEWDRDKFVDLVKNVYRVLLSRAMKGCYVYFMDKETENFFRSRTEEAVLEYE